MVSITSDVSVLCLFEMSSNGDEFQIMSFFILFFPLFCRIYLEDKKITKTK